MLFGDYIINTLKRKNRKKRNKSIYNQLRVKDKNIKLIIKILND